MTLGERISQHLMILQDPATQMLKQQKIKGGNEFISPLK